jgi:hypothetical protein
MISRKVNTSDENSPYREEVQVENISLATCLEELQWASTQL